MSVCAASSVRFQSYEGLQQVYVTCIKTFNEIKVVSRFLKIKSPFGGW